MELLVSVIIPTYNQAKYISQAIEGALKQKTNFPFEILIGEDDSSDGTRKICIEYAKNHPEKIRLFLNDRKNVIYINGSPTGRWNMINLIKNSKGKYIAFFEGDDYWTDPYKLQYQVDFLEANPDYGLVFTDADFLYERNGKLIPAYDKTFRKRIPTGNVLHILLQGINPYRTCTSMFRRSLIWEYTDMIRKSKFKMGDKILWFIIAGQAKIGYIDRSTAVYRIKEKSASHPEDLKAFVLFLRNSYRANIFFSDYYKQPFNRKKSKIIYRNAILKYCVDKKDYKKLIEYSGCFTIALAAIAKDKLHDLIVFARKLRK